MPVEEYPPDIVIFGLLNEVFDRCGYGIKALQHEGGEDNLAGDDNDADEQRKEKERPEEAGDAEE